MQLKRQSAAHAAHLTEELAILRQAQEQKAQAELDSQITSLSTQYLDDISQGQSKLYTCICQIFHSIRSHELQVA